MKVIWLSLLGKIIEYLTSKEFIDLVKKLVYSMFADDTKSGEQKRAHVLNELKLSGMNFGSNLAGLAIESFVTIAKEQGTSKLK
jgi:hypothetical protein